ncbi:SDR family NAD(P)-dependent oxidoreductase [Govanella unica]|uniref:SDR family NAD(P)-dependent oxidoreductase n=1 Tax=Govanella unica TaxID=2975056 RepID=A0A9X3TZ14_9PROT|nr:SDR family NAD(P)-dependent oxidoreductase [Govania unica]MDA5194350.1 SDR family NAD(P)-dependent oxidoreductase [Govania unica]
MRNPRAILITGASSGIGAALARTYARPDVTLFLGGRDAERLATVAAEVRALGAYVHQTCLDVTDKAAMSDWIRASDAIAPLDLVIANAGVSYGLKTGDDLAEHVERTFAVNVDGVFHTIHPAIDVMRSRGAGQIAIMASLAGFTGLPSSPAYSTSKATVKAYGEAMRGFLRPYGIEVSVICPGFIISPMTARNPFPMPFLMSDSKAAGIMVAGLAKNKARIAFPLPMLAAVRLAQLLPAAWVDFLFSQLPAKDRSS